MPGGSEGQRDISRHRAAERASTLSTGICQLAYGVVRVTLSNVAEANEAVVRLLTASPTYAFGAMVTVWLVPNCVQAVPLLDPYMVNTFPLRTSYSQFGGVALPMDW